MRKKLLITLSILFGFVAVLLILFWTLFGLSSVSVQYHSTKDNLTISNSEIVKAGEFRKHASVLFEGKKKSIKKIEKFASENENFAYLRIINIETKFPNKFVIHVSEREELFSVAYGEKFLICDRDLRVLRIMDGYASSATNPILLEDLTIQNTDVKVGDFLQVQESNIKNLYGALLRNNQSLAMQLGHYKKMQISSYEDAITHENFFALSMETFSGRKFVIRNIDFALNEKVQKMLAVESELFALEVDGDGDIIKAGEKIYVVRLESGEYVSFDAEKHEEADKVALSYDLLSNCYIKIDNLTLTKHIKRTSADIYYAFVEE